MNKPSKLDEQLQDIYMAGWHATAPDFNDPEFLEARTNLLALIEEEVIGPDEKLNSTVVLKPSTPSPNGRTNYGFKVSRNKLRAEMRLRKDAL